MKLDRNHGVGKYAVVKMRAIHELGPADQVDAASAMGTLSRVGVLNYGEPQSQGEHFVLMLKDKYAEVALAAYAGVAAHDDPEYAGEVMDLANRAGPNSPFCKSPD